MRHITRRSFAVLALTAVAVLAVSSGVAWAFWRFTGGGSAAARIGRAAELQISAVPQPNAPLFPGSTTDIFVTVRNPNPFPVRVHALRPGFGAVSVDAAHAARGCVRTGVSLISSTYGVSWHVAANASRTFGLPNGIKMTNESDSACHGATFQVPLAAIVTND